MFPTTSERRQAAIEAVVQASVAADYGTLLSHEQLQELTEAPSATWLYGVVRQACKRLLKGHTRTLVSERGKGYRVAHPSQHADIATAHLMRGRRQTSTALAVVRGTDQRGLSQSERQRSEVLSTQIGMLARAQSSMLERMRRNEEIQTMLIGSQESTDRRQSALEQRLERLERMLPDGEDPEPED